jgi:Cu/Ag efflux protein CusF
MGKVLRISVVTILAASVACSYRSGETGHEKHYQLSGKVVGLDSKRRTATVDGEAIPNFMEAMTMEYPIRDRDDFKRLRVGDRITATVNVNEDGEYNLSRVQKTTLGKP